MDATPAPIPPPPTSAAAPAPRSLSQVEQLAAEKLVGGWRRLYSLFKAAESKVDAARHKVEKWMSDVGIDSITTRHGTLTLQSREDVSWKALAESQLKPDVIEKLKPQFTTTSKRFLRALPSWGK